ncbi:MAG: hypothetical protein JWN00_1451 [Actinomycetia bacterium]|nr:hypothetical protein [Actinomycetes bacterium]
MGAREERVAAEAVDLLGVFATLETPTNPRCTQLRTLEALIRAYPDEAARLLDAIRGEDPS